MSEYTKFADAASGEWDGVTATFSSEGAPQPIPPYYVPDSYREWGIELYDWNTQCSMLAGEERVAMGLKRLMPTVGCEADAVAFTEESTAMFEEDLAGGLHPPVLADGSYSWGPASIAADSSKLRIESCVASLGGARERIRVVQHLMKGWQDGRWMQTQVEVHHERYDGPYARGQELRACGYGMKNFAESEKCTLESLGGSWGKAAGRRYRGSGSRGAEVEEVVVGRLSDVTPSSEGVLPLPLGGWARVMEEEGEVYLEVGVLDEGGSSRGVVGRRYIGGMLSEVVLGREQREE